MQELINLLTREQILLERLLYRVVNVRNLLVGGQPRFLAWASDDVAHAAEEVSAIELTRATYYQRLADTRTDLPEQFDWDALLEIATDTQRTLLTSIRNEIGTTSAELKGHLASCAELSEKGMQSASAALAQLQGIDITVAMTPSAGLDARRHIDRAL